MMQELLLDYEAYLKAQGKNPHTIRAYLKTGRILKAFLNKDINDLTETDIIVFLNNYQKPSSKARHYFALKNLLDFHETPEPISRLRSPPVIRELRWWLTPSEIVSMVRKCHQSRDRCLLSLQYAYALRSGAVSHLNTSDSARANRILSVESCWGRGDLNPLKSVVMESHFRAKFWTQTFSNGV